jgi:hypothetical protein
MKVKEFKVWFADYSAGVPVEGPNSGQWKKLQATVDSLEVEAPKPVVEKAPVEKKTKE